MAQDETRDRTQTGPRVDMREAGMPQGQSPARTDQRADPPLTAMQRAARDRYAVKDAMMKAVENPENRAILERSLKNQGISWESFLSALEIGLTQTMKSKEDFFDKVSIMSFLEAVKQACHLGLMPDGKEGAIVNYGPVAQFLPMVEGFVKKLWATGLIVDINHNVVRDGDEIDFEEGDNGFVRQKRNLKRPANAETIGAWCVINLTTGGKIIEICDQKDLTDIAKVSKAKAGPRDAWADEMHRKGPFRRAVKRMPKSQQLNDLIEVDNGHYTLGQPRIDTLPAAGQRGRHARAMPTDSIFEDRAERRPVEPEAATAAAEPQAEEIDVAAAATAVVTKLRHAVDLVELYDVADFAMEAPVWESFTEEHAEWLDQTLRARAAELGLNIPLSEPDAMAMLYDALPAEAKEETNEEIEARHDAALEENPGPDDDDDAGGVPALGAKLTSDGAVKVYEDADLWKSDILAKMAALAVGPAGSFWKTNQPYVLHARDHGFEEAAEKILKVAADRGFYKAEG